MKLKNPLNFLGRRGYDICVCDIIFHLSNGDKIVFIAILVIPTDKKTSLNVLEYEGLTYYCIFGIFYEF